MTRKSSFKNVLTVKRRFIFLRDRMEVGKRRFYRHWLVLFMDGKKIGKMQKMMDQKLKNHHFLLIQNEVFLRDFDFLKITKKVSKVIL